MEMRYTFGGFLFLSLICYHDVEFISYFINIIYRICKKKKKKKSQWNFHWSNSLYRSIKNMYIYFPKEACYN